MTDKNINATVNELKNTLESNGISMSFLDLDTLPVETTSFSASEGTWRMLRNLARKDAEEGTIEAAASKLAELCRFSNE